ncbi:hypothetical protein LEP1GSC032_1708 [Leptospira interrogans str. 2002000631]|nr:hypothetical protein LEP1GSC032_1708 [Leptospira interrogans str. 2002000631]
MNCIEDFQYSYNYQPSAIFKYKNRLSKIKKSEYFIFNIF